ncbi:MAG TPA: von Willebrand factor type A domain-containing protein [Labilithrix sp.]|nr:von Willebrand factor type A domain-containing protein [Labilithrix sp.]
MSLTRRSPLIAVALALVAGCGASHKESQAPAATAPAMEQSAGRYATAAQFAGPVDAASIATVAPMGGAIPPAAPMPLPMGLAQSAPEPTGTEAYKDYGVNPFVDSKKDRLSTFSIDVDTASYAIARRKLNESTLPPFASVRAEEFLNSFDYDYEGPEAGNAKPFHVHMTAAPSPFTKGHHLVRIGVQAKRITAKERVPVHLVYLVDTSGSMGGKDRIELAKQSLEMLTGTLRDGDTVAICTYAGDVRTVLTPTGIDRKADILRAIRSLRTGGGTSMGSGVQLAYDLASKTLVPGHVNRVVVLSDGDANIGNTTHEQVLASIRRYKDRGITLSTVGFGSGNYKDVMMERLADEGDGNYTYIDSEAQARKVFTEQVDGLLQVVARDVKIQVELDPSVVARYRLIGYENRDIADKDFRNDKVDAGEVGAGHSVTALYDVELLRTDASPLTVRMRHKPAKNALNGGSDTAIESKFVMPKEAILGSFSDAPTSFRFATAVAGFAEILRKSPAAAEWRLADIERIAASSAAGKSERVELVGLVRKAAALSGQSVAAIAR